CDVRSLPAQERSFLEAELARLAEGTPGTDFRLETTAEASASRADPAVGEALRQAGWEGGGRQEGPAAGLCPGFSGPPVCAGGGGARLRLRPGRPAAGRRTPQCARRRRMDRRGRPADDDALLPRGGAGAGPAGVTGRLTWALGAPVSPDRGWAPGPGAGALDP